MPQIALANTGWTEAKLTVALRNRYAGTAFAFLPQVANGTGSFKSRTADALVMSLWPSRGLDLIGFEIKISRSDWLQELRRPEKADSIAKYCDHWYLVVASEDIVQPGELPSAWGLMAPKGKVLRIVKEAVQTDAQPISRVFLAALLRNAAGAIVPKAEIHEELQRAREKGRKDAEQRQGWKSQQQERDLAQLRQSIAQFEEISGVKLDGYNGPRLGKALKLIQSSGIETYIRDLQSVRTTAQRVADGINNGLREFTPQEPPE